MLIADAVHIWREPDGDYHVEWRTTDGKVEVTVEPMDASPSEATYCPDTESARFSGLEPARRHRFLVRDEFGNEVLAGERRIHLEGSPNFRDFGGYSTAAGQRVKWGYLFRSGQLSALSDADVAQLEALELDLVFDFRREEEQELEPSRLPGSRAPRVVSLPIIPGSNSRFFEEAEGHTGDRQAMFDFMLEINSDFALAQTQTYGRMFEEILARQDARFLVHCAAGKDRTGFAAAIILLALGVPREVVMSDYLLTSRFFEPAEQVERLRRKYQMEHMAWDAILPMLEVHEDYLLQALNAIDAQYPSVEDYLADALAVGPAELAELRGRYLE